MTAPDAVPGNAAAGQWPDADALRTTVDHVAIVRLQNAYADTVTRRAWSELDDLFVADAVVHIDTVSRPAFEVVGPAALGEFIEAAVQRFAFFEFVVLNAHIMLPPGGGERATARVNMCEVRREVATLDWSIAYGVYHDRYLRTAQGWRIEGRHYQSLTRTGGDVFPYPHRFD